MREDLEKVMMEIGEPFSIEEINNMMAIACDPKTKQINYEHYINLLLVCIDILYIYIIYIIDNVLYVIWFLCKYIFYMHILLL